MYFVLKDIKRRWRGRRVCVYIPPPPGHTPTKYVCVIKRDNSKTEIGLNVPAFYFFGDLLILKCTYTCIHVHVHVSFVLYLAVLLWKMVKSNLASGIQLIYYFRKYDAIACNMSKIYCYAIYKVTEILIFSHHCFLTLYK